MLNKLVRPSKGVIKFELALDREKVPHPHSAVADIMRPKAKKKAQKPGQGRRRMTSDYYYKHTHLFIKIPKEAFWQALLNPTHAQSYKEFSILGHIFLSFF